MGIGWSEVLTIFVAIVLARVFERAIFPNRGSSTAVGAEVHSPAVPVVVYANPIDEFIAKNHPGAYR